MTYCVPESVPRTKANCEPCDYGQTQKRLIKILSMQDDPSVWMDEHLCSLLGQGSITIRLGHMACALGTWNVPWASCMQLGHFLCALGTTHTPWAFENVKGACVILCFSAGLACVFSPNPVRNSHYKYQPSSFIISRSELWQFKRNATFELQVSFYLLLDFLGLFLSLVICF